jgi:hypothetical protein
MAERTHISGSPACGQWETLLTDALDGQLKPGDEAAFTAHMAVCPTCAELFEEAHKGRAWLEFLSPEPEVPAGLLDKILAQTGPGQIAGYGLIAAGGAAPVPQNLVPDLVPAWQRPGVFGFLLRFAEPRLMMTAAMAFFSIALTLNLAGIRLANLRLNDLHLATLRPTAVRSYMERQLSMASIPIIRYYDHLHVVYELESRMRELRGVAEDVDHGEEYEQRYETQPAGPGESRRNSGHGNGPFHAVPAQSPTSPALEPVRDASNEYLETSLTIHCRSAHSSGSTTKVRERSTVWTA